MAVASVLVATVAVENVSLEREAARVSVKTVIVECLFVVPARGWVLITSVLVVAVTGNRGKCADLSYDWVTEASVLVEAVAERQWQMIW